MSKKDEYFAMMESQIKKWDAEVDKLRARATQMSAEARAKYDEQIKAMRASRDAANKKLQEMRTASESAWQHMQTGVDSAWASMKTALERRPLSSRSRPSAADRRRLAGSELVSLPLGIRHFFGWAERSYPEIDPVGQDLEQYIQFTLFSAFYSPLISAMSAGFLGAEGLDPQWSISPPGSSALAALQDGSAHVFNRR